MGKLLGIGQIMVGSSAKTAQFSARQFWLFYLIFAIIEFYLFRQYAEQDIVNFYPKGSDQASYLPLIYQTYENIKAWGLVKGFWESPALPTGMLFPAHIVMYLFFFGASRFSALLVNFTYFMLLQTACLLTLQHLTKKTYFLFLFFGLFLTLNTPFLSAGGNLFDIRIDFMAFCLYGIFVTFIIRSNFFLERKWVFFAALLTCFLVLLRTLTLVYFAGTVSLFFFYLLAEKCLKISSQKVASERNTRLINMLLFGLIVCAITLPFIWLNREALYNYYMIGHVLGEEKNVRADVSGITGLYSLIIYYPYMLFFSHFGERALIFVLALLLTYGAIQFFCRKQIETDHHVRIKKDTLGFAFFSFSILIPLIALTLDLNKSPIVASIMVVPSLWLIFWYCLYVNDTRVISGILDKCLSYGALAILGIGLATQWNTLHRHFNKKTQANLANLSTMYLDIGNYAVSKNWPSFQISFDQLTEELSSGGIATLYYEKTGRLLRINVGLLGGTIFTIKKADALESLAKAQVFVLNLNPYGYLPPYPANESMHLLKPVLKQYAEKHFKQLGDYQYHHALYRVYVSEN